MARHLFDSEFLFGIHEPGGEQHMLEAGRPGWIVFTEGVGSDPNDHSGRDYRQWSDKGLGIIVRLNNGYHPAGTIPNSTQYTNFATRCANFVAASQGCKLWIIGNEMNFAIERPPRINASFEQPAPAPAVPSWMIWFKRNFVRPEPPLPTPAPTEKGDPFYHGNSSRFNAINDPDGAVPTPPSDGESSDADPTTLSDGDGEIITPAMYVKCYKLCREKIHALEGHGTDRVLVGAVAPWNNQTRYVGNENGDWAHYFRDILTQLGPELCDGFTLHTYTHGQDANLITNEDKMGAPFQNRFYHFRAYQDFMRAVPAGMRHLPCYITETDEDAEWKDENIAWIQRAYGEINWWNRQTGNQQIMSLVLYRWPRIDKWFIEGKNGVISDFRDALREEYRWKRVTAPALPAVQGEILRTRDWLNLRKTPNGEVLGQVPARAQAKVLNGAPTLVDGVYWWNVDVAISTGATLKGWLAQESSQGLMLLERANAGVTPPVVTPPTNPPTNPPTDPGAPVAGLKAGGNARTLDLARLRKTPGVMNKPVDDILADIAPGTVLAVIEGPMLIDSLRFWKVRGKAPGGNELTGWMAERAPNGVQLLEAVAGGGEVEPPGGEEPDQEEPPPPSGATFKVGERVITLNFVRLRKNPGLANKPADDVIADLNPQVVGIVKGGPRAVDGMNWWQIEMPVNGLPVTGWAAEMTPTGVTLLGPASETPTPPPSTTGIKLKDLVVARTAVNVRKTAGMVGKPADDLLGYFENRTTLNVVDGPKEVDGMRWWRVGGITLSRGEVVGWVAEKLLDGTLLISAADKLPGTAIPTPAENRWLGAPFAGVFGISQLWGERPGVYSRFTYDGVPLKGHNGIDFLTPTGTQLTAVDAGVIADAVLGDPGGFGNYVKITHSWGESLYAHMDTVAVARGQQVTRGEVIGTSGNTGFSGGPHLHFTIRINPFVRTDGWGGFSDPLPYMNPKDFVLPNYVLRPAADAGPDFGEQPPAPHDYAPGLGPEVPGLQRP